MSGSPSAQSSHEQAKRPLVFPGHACGLVRENQAGQTISLVGWLAHRRDHGGLIFVDLRDSSGVVQVVAEPGTEAYPVVDRARPEWILEIEGRVALRPSGTENPQLPTGAVEVRATRARVLAESKTPPFLIDDRITVDEAKRLEFRYLDLRRPRMLHNLRARAEIVAAVREAMRSQGFIEVETPVLTRATPEGARDFLVPSRLEKGRFYALAQSPQLYKQLLMVAGLGRYYQIARCFRDEDLRADRQPEFTQLDLEMSFATEDDIMAAVELAVVAASEAVGLGAPETPFPRITWREAQRRFGTDKPDLRLPSELVDLTDVFASSDFRAFRSVVEAGGVVVGLRIPSKGSAPSRTWLDSLIERAKALGAAGLVWAVATERGLQSPVSKYWSDEEQGALVERTGARPGDTVALVAGEDLSARQVLGRLRLEVLSPASDIGLRWCWIVDFPLVSWDEKQQKFEALHHPFCAPHPDDEDLVRAGADAVMKAGADAVRARAFDLVVDGWELGSGSIRIHDPQLQRAVFKLLGIDELQAEERFGYLLEAFQYGAPPHGGFAVGLDRLIAVLLGEESIREVIAFPKTQSGQEPMLRTPAPVAEEQLQELGIALRGHTRKSPRIAEQGGL